MLWRKCKKIWCDNAGENKTLKENCAICFEKNSFEFTSLVTPQKNKVTEREFATLYSRMCSMMELTGLHEKLKTGIWTKWMATVTKLENIMVNPHKNVFLREVPRPNIRLCKTLKEFWINGSCTQYRQCKIQHIKSRNNLNFPRICTKTYGRHIPHVKYTKKTYCTKLWCDMDE